MLFTPIEWNRVYSEPNAIWAKTVRFGNYAVSSRQLIAQQPIAVTVSNRWTIGFQQSASAAFIISCLWMQSVEFSFANSLWSRGSPWIRLICRNLEWWVLADCVAAETAASFSLEVWWFIASRERQSADLKLKLVQPSILIAKTYWAHGILRKKTIEILQPLVNKTLVLRRFSNSNRRSLQKNLPVQMSFTSLIIFLSPLSPQF